MRAWSHPEDDVVDAVARHGNAPSLSLERRDEVHLVLWSDLAVALVDPELLGDGRRGGQPVTGGHRGSAA